MNEATRVTQRNIVGVLKLPGGGVILLGPVEIEVDKGGDPWVVTVKTSIEAFPEMQ